MQLTKIANSVIMLCSAENSTRTAAVCVRDGRRGVGLEEYASLVTFLLS
jgi:hypothetical protein